MLVNTEGETHQCVDGQTNTWTQWYCNSVLPFKTRKV